MGLRYARRKGYPNLMEQCLTTATVQNIKRIIRVFEERAQNAGATHWNRRLTLIRNHACHRNHKKAGECPDENSLIECCHKHNNNNLNLAKVLVPEALFILLAVPASDLITGGGPWRHQAEIQRHGSQQAI